MINANYDQRSTVYQSVIDLFKTHDKPVKKSQIVFTTGLPREQVHTVLIWLKRWKLIHNHGKSKRRWFPMRIPKAGICWNHGDRLKNGICETCERVAQYSYGKTNGNSHSSEQARELPVHLDHK